MRFAALWLMAACTCGPGSPEPEEQPRAERGDPVSSDSIGDLRAGMATCLPKVDACLAGVVAEHPGVSGRLAVRVVIHDGAVQRTEVVTDRTGVPAAAACATDVISGCAFAPGLDDSITLPIAVPPVARPSPLAPTGP